MKWRKITLKQYWHRMEILPPTAMNARGFLFGARDRRRSHGAPRYEAFVRVKDVAYSSESPITVEQFYALRARDLPKPARSNAAAGQGSPRAGGATARGEQHGTDRSRRRRSNAHNRSD
jgi:hypothetical protein